MADFDTHGMFAPLSSNGAADINGTADKPHKGSTAADRLVAEGWTYHAKPPARSMPVTKGATATWHYFYADGALAFVVARYDDHGSKKRFALWTCWHHDDGRIAWHMAHPPTPRLLFNLPDLAPRPSAHVLVVEGEKTADAARRLFPDHVVTTSSAGSNAADKTDWSPLVGRQVIVWPDHDEAGAKYAADVVRLARATGVASVRVVAVPPAFPKGWDLADMRPEGFTPADLAAMLEAAGEPAPDAANGASGDGQETPTPLLRPLERPEPFPCTALGPLENIACAITEITQAPPAIAASSVLAAVTLAAQSHVNVVLPIGNGSIKPVSGMFVTIAASGERKSATEDMAIAAVTRHEAILRADHEVAQQSFKNRHAAWDAERKSVLAPSAKVGGKLSRENDLRALGDEPSPPLTPIKTMAEPTVEGLSKLLANGQPSVGIFTAEGGQFVGGHAMSQDAKLRSAAALSALWDGSPIKRVRAGDGAIVIPNRRASMHLLVQFGAAGGLIEDPVLRDQGLLSRMLVTAPETTMGTRFFRPASGEARKAVTDFEGKLFAALSRPEPIRAGTRNELDPRALALSSEAVVQWVAFHDHVERLLAPEGAYAPIKGFAAKMAEHAARLAAVLTWWADHDASEIPAGAIECGIRLAEHYGSEMLRLTIGGNVSPEIADAEMLRVWLTSVWQHPSFSVADVCQRGPGSIRTAARVRELLAILETEGHIAKIKGGAVVDGRKRRHAWTIWGRS